MNREIVKKLAYLITLPFSFHFLRNYSNQNFIFPFYHLVAENTPTYIKHFYTAVNHERFISDLEFLLKHYQPATIKDLSNFVASGKKFKKPLFFLSFDDGLKECFEIVYPILKEKGIQATFFINPDFVDNRDLFYKFKLGLVIDKLQKNIDKNTYSEISKRMGILNHEITDLLQKISSLGIKDLEKINELAGLLEIDFKETLLIGKPYMTTEQLNEIEQDGFLIGSHSLNHPLFSQLNEKEQIDEFEKSMQFIKEKFNPQALTFAFPFTDFNVKKSFFEYLDKSLNVDFSFGTAGIKNDKQAKHIQRIPMEVNGMKSAQQILRTEYAYYMFKSFFGKNTILR